MGYDLEDWLGNREADRLAGAVTEVRGPAPALVDLQRNRLRMANAAAGVIGAVHQAALAHDSVPGGFFNVMKRKPRRLPTEKGAFVAKRAWQKPVQGGLVQPEGPAPCGVHQLSPADGDPAQALE